MFNTLGAYLLARAGERSTVGGAVATIVSAFGFSVAPDKTVAFVNAVVAVAGLVSAVIPGGK